MFVPPNDWPNKYIVTETRQVSPNKCVVTYTTVKGTLSSSETTYHKREIVPGVVKFICESDQVYEDGDVIAYQVSLTCFELYHKSTGTVERHCVDDGWPHHVDGVYCVRDQVVVHLVNSIGDDILYVVSDPELHYLSNLSAHASVSVKDNMLMVGVDSDESTDGLPPYVTVYLRC